MEGFLFGGLCLYHRVLVPVRTNWVDLPSWLYIVGDRRPSASKSEPAKSGADFQFVLKKTLDSNWQ
jgi:hypothetical protein